MVADAEVLEAKIDGCLGEFFKGGEAVTFGGVAVKGAFELRPFDEVRKGVIFGSVDFAKVFTKLGRDVLETKRFVKGFFGGAWDEGFRAIGVDMEEAPF